MKVRHITFVAAFAVALGAGMPAQADPPPWAPAHGKRAKQEREYRYVYYPAQQVYYSPEQHLWFWMNGGNWQFGVSLPAYYHVQPVNGISLTLESPRPYAEHVYVEEQYGRPWRESHQDRRRDNDRHHRQRDRD